MNSLHILAALLGLFALLVATTTGQGRPMDVHDLHALKRFQSYSVSSSKLVVYDVRHWVRLGS